MNYLWLLHKAAAHPLGTQYVIMEMELERFEQHNHEKLDEPHAVLIPVPFLTLELQAAGAGSETFVLCFMSGFLIEGC